MTQTSADWSVGVVIPARNEARTITACLNSILEAADRSQLSLNAFRVVVVADFCHDSTATLARTILLNRGHVIESKVASAGAARQLGAAEILTHFADAPRSRLWIANTDADTCVPRTWFERQLSLANRGYCGVAGIVRIGSAGRLDRETLQTLLSDYTIHPDGTHPHVHGANLGVRADAYVDAGCWNRLALAEDHCLWSRVNARGWPTAACAKTVVRTSGRLRGRATGGFADLLRRRLEVAACTP
jgi:glycosyltransferase involved in cell wall biosynthesis